MAMIDSQHTRSGIHPDIPHELARRVLRWMEAAQARWPAEADRLRFAARIRLLRVDLRRGDIAAVKRNLSHLEAALQ